MTINQGVGRLKKTKKNGEAPGVAGTQAQPGLVWERKEMGQGGRGEW